MSDENAPKLRLKPKLAGETPATPQQPSAPVTPPSPAPAPAESTPAAEPAKMVRLRPRLSTEPAAAAAPLAEPAVEAVPEAPAPAAPESTEAAKPRISLRPRSAGPAEAAATPAAEAPSEEETPAPAAPPFPPPPVSVAKFPPPPQAGKFPPPPQPGQLPKPAVEKKEAAEAGEEAKPKGLKQKLVQYGIVALLVLGALAWKAGKYFLDRTVSTTIEHKLFSKDDPKPATPPKTAPAQAVDKAKPADAPVESAKTDVSPEKTTPPPSTTVAPPVESTPAVAKPVGPPPIPPATAAFKLWVSNLKFSLRAGSRTRILVERTSYDVGDVVNPQLGIIFAGYDAEKGVVTFKDKTGAIVERRY